MDGNFFSMFNLAIRQWAIRGFLCTLMISCTFISLGKRSFRLICKKRSISIHFLFV